MATEIKSDLDHRWPSAVRLPVVLTFEHQSGEGTPPRPGDRPTYLPARHGAGANYLGGGQVEYGGRGGIWNILEVLDKLGVRATFLVSGLTAEKCPDAVRAACKAGHEIAGMGFGFEKVRTSSREREQ